MGKVAAAAEQTTGGKAMGARPKERQKLFFYQVQTISKGTIKTVLKETRQKDQKLNPQKAQAKVKTNQIN